MITLSPEREKIKENALIKLRDAISKKVKLNPSEEENIENCSPKVSLPQEMCGDIQVSFSHSSKGRNKANCCSEWVLIC